MRILYFICFIGTIAWAVDGQWGSTRNERLQMSFIPQNHIRSNPNANFQSVSSLNTFFPQCLSTGEASNLLNQETIRNLFNFKLQEEDSKLTHERARNIQLNNRDVMDFDAVQLRTDTLNGALLARTATKVADEIIRQLGCITNATVTHLVDDFLRQIRIPEEYCPYRRDVDCAEFIRYRTVTGVCNNLQRPYQGSAQTAFARLLPAAYEDGLHLPRSQSVLGGPLPKCREISLNMGSRPVYDVSYNNLFVSYGQFIVHDITLSTPVTDSGRTPITSCTCDNRDSEMCTVIDIPSNDPFMARQQCMASPATAQGFTEQMCTLGVKDHLNGNSHYIDLSVTYGSTRKTAHGLRTGSNGLLKSSKTAWSKFELPPGQIEGNSCVDGTETQRCFAAGDSRIMENVLLSGLQAQWLRLHNVFVKELALTRPDWKNSDEILYEEAKHILSALHQRYIYEDWLPILIGKSASDHYIGDSRIITRYDPNVPAVVFNEVSTAALRLHTLARDLFTRCKPNGQFIDQVRLHDINSRCKLAYDDVNNGVDSFICGSLFDYGFAGDTNYAEQIHHNLFETKNSRGETISNDIVSLNICRAREHGIPGYNAYRQLCGLRRAEQFSDFADTISPEGIQKLAAIYQHPEDVDIFVGINHETPVSGGIVGPVSACLIGTQFNRLKFGDRFFYTHEGQFTREQFKSILDYSYACFICHSTDIEKVPANPFRPPNDQTNPLVACNACPIFDFKPWRL